MLLFLFEQSSLPIGPGEVTYSTLEGKDGRFPSMSIPAASVSDSDCVTIAAGVQSLTESYLMKRHYGGGIPDWTFVLTPEIVRNIVDSDTLALFLAVNSAGANLLSDSISAASTTGSPQSVRSPQSAADSPAGPGGVDSQPQQPLIELENIVGCVMAATFPALAGIRGRIEDLVVHPSARGNFFGKRLVHACFEFCKSLQCVDVQLTSGLGRAASHQVYRSQGMDTRETLVFVKYLE